MMMMMMMMIQTRLVVHPTFLDLATALSTQHAVPTPLTMLVFLDEPFRE